MNQSLNLAIDKIKENLPAAEADKFAKDAEQASFNMQTNNNMPTNYMLEIERFKLKTYARDKFIYWMLGGNQKEQTPLLAITAEVRELYQCKIIMSRVTFDHEWENAEKNAREIRIESIKIVESLDDKLQKIIKSHANSKAIPKIQKKNSEQEIIKAFIELAKASAAGAVEAAVVAANGYDYAIAAVIELVATSNIWAYRYLTATQKEVGKYYDPYHLMAKKIIKIMNERYLEGVENDYL